jgi:uncharacterized protein
MSVGSSEARRAELVSALQDSSEPITGGEFSSRLGVSRQAIVNDIAILRAAGQPIIGSPRGYLLGNLPSKGTDVIACRHGREDARRELEILVDRGILVLDVTVEHSVYGEVRATMMVESRSDVDRYAEALRQGGDAPLSSITGGVHLHTVQAPNHDALEAAKRELREAGILLED